MCSISIKNQFLCSFSSQQPLACVPSWPPAFGIQPRRLGSACDSTCPVTAPCFCQNSYPSRSANNGIAFEGERSWDFDLETRAAPVWHRSGLWSWLKQNSRPVPPTMFLFGLGQRLEVDYKNIMGAPLNLRKPAPSSHAIQATWLPIST